MTGSSWSLVIAVLVFGLAVGTIVTVLLRRRSTTGAAAQRDRELLLTDLRARQEDLYKQLRVADESERAELELAAARNLQAIEEAGGELASAAAGADDSVPEVKPAAVTSPAAAARASSTWLGFLGGVACAVLVAVLIVWAQRDARPREDAGMPSAPAAADDEHPMGAQLGVRDAEALDQLARRVEDDPTDVMARKEYAAALLSTGQFFPAFEQAQILLASDERDPDGLYVAGMVRMRMGQESVARELLDRLLEDYPEHIPGLTALGVLELRASGLEAAEALWERALAASGGSNPEIERLVATAREQVAGGGVSAPAPAPAAAAPAVPAAPAGDAYTVRLDLAEGSPVAPSAVLFVTLRQGDAGPPAAAKRISNPRFPITVSLSAADSMLGRPLPDSGTVSARLDLDGSAATRVEGEPAAEAELGIGESASLTLQ